MDLGITTESKRTKQKPKRRKKAKLTKQRHAKKETPLLANFDF
jgi:hypothetical protein